jgi:hypothetical protein
MSKEFYENLSTFFTKDGEEEIVDDYQIDIDDDTLNQEYLKILPELDKINQNLDLSKYV